MLVNRLQGEVRAHLLLNTPDFKKAAKTVEDYYSNVYIDDEFTAGINAMKIKHNKGKEYMARKAKIGEQKGSTTPYNKGKGKYQSRPYYVKGKGTIPYQECCTT
eukprot:119802-Amphidinium_carterae.2